MVDETLNVYDTVVDGTFGLEAEDSSSSNIKRRFKPLAFLVQDWDADAYDAAGWRCVVDALYMALTMARTYYEECHEEEHGKARDTNKSSVSE